MRDFQIIVAGRAGEGSKKAGLVIAKIFNAYGLDVFIHEDYQSLIRGGHNFSQISVSDRKADVVREEVDFILALNEESAVKELKKIKKDTGVLICDTESTNTDFSEQGVKTVKVPLTEIVNQAEGALLMKNTALLSAFSKMIGVEWEDVESVLRGEFKKETEKNIQVAKVAFERTEKIQEMEVERKEPLPLISGNQAVAMGALDAGLECFFAYPMTPATGILTFLSNLKKIEVHQVESEISSAGMVIGAAYAGKRSMTGTSGGGFALMTESLSISAMAETPLVIALSQRMGPASGAPTYQAQGDLLFAFTSGQGDMIRFIVTPGDADDAYILSGKAMNTAWKYQIPAIILLDKEISENTYTFKKEYQVEKQEVLLGEDSDDYRRYSGEDISPVAFPGGDAVVKATGYEHDEKGIAVEDAESIRKMHDKRKRKYEMLKKEVEEMEGVRVTGSGSTAVIFWGSTKGAVQEAVKEKEVKAVQILIMQPFPEKQLREALQGVDKIICVENSAMGQVSWLLKSYGFSVDEEILKYDGRPFSAEELREKLQDL